MAVVGFGDVGRACAEKAKAFKMKRDCNSTQSGTLQE
jgi:phosphoglycerate dehydrogenase-like enzyme